jgi:antirestriction protein ArdC
MKTTNAEVREAVTERIMAKLHAGHIPWRKPWRYAGGAAGFPVNVVTRVAYHGINPLLLAIDAEDKGLSSPWWGTFGQWAAKCGMVKRTNPRTGKEYWYSPDGTPRGVMSGQHGTKIVLSKRVFVKETDPVTGEKVAKRVPMLRFYTVFNAEQCAQVPAKYLPSAAEWEPVAEIADAEQVIARYVATGSPSLVHVRGDHANYNWRDDVIRMPERDQFPTSAAYYGTKFHEVGHSSGHESRLNREPAVCLGEWRHGDATYAREELVAQMTSAMLQAETGIEVPEELDRSAAYIENWLTALDNDRSLVSQAATAAQQAVDLIMGRASAYGRDEDDQADQDEQPEAVAA